MAYIGESENSMRPKKGDTTINLPVTFDYSGGRNDANKSKILWVFIVGVIGFIVGIGTMTSSEGFFLFNILLGLLIMFGVSLVVRFLIMKEHKVRNRMAKLQEDDFARTYGDFWGIHSIDDFYPYYAHLRNGKTAIYIQFEKDVILGKVSEAEYEHYEAIGDAYNLAGSMNIGMCHIDYMGNIGNDERLIDCFDTLPDIENEDLRDVMTDIYSNLQDLMNEKVSTFDVYVFTFKSSEQLFWYSLQKILGCMLEANYISFKILNKDDLRDLTKNLYNLHDFSIVEANSEAFVRRTKTGIVPISILSPDGTVSVLNKTVEEKREESLLKQEEAKLRKEEEKRRKRLKKNRKSKKDKEKENEEIDIFGN